MKNSVLRFVITLLSLVGTSLAGCDDSPSDPGENGTDQPSVAEVRFGAGSELGFYAGESIALGAAAYDSAGDVIADADIEVTVSDPAVVAVSDEGVLTALSQGTATVIATVDTISATLSIRVTEFVEISALDDPVCARDVEGAVWCIGTEWLGQVNWPHPLYETWTKISGELAFTSLTSGYQYTCGLADDVYCWGSNEDGKLGSDQVTGHSSEPVAVTDQPELVFVDAGLWHSCGLDATGNAYCWGRGGYGELGNGEFADRYPTLVAGDHTWLDIDAGDRKTCGIASDGITYCWGDMRVLGDFPSPVAIDSLPANLEHIRVDIVACGSIGATIHCWGPEDQEPAPSQMTMPDDVVDFEIGTRSICALLENGEIYCWGSNERSLLGDPTLTSSTTPVRIDAGGRSFVALTGEWSLHCALASDGGVYCWGGGSIIGRPFPHTVVPTRVPAPLP